MPVFSTEMPFILESELKIKAMPQTQKTIMLWLK
jgi:hypothetical protein